MTEDNQVTAFLGISYAILCLTPWIILIVKMMQTYVRMNNADRTLYNELCSFRSLFRTPGETQALLRKMYERDPRIERLYADTWKWFKWTAIVWIGGFLVVILFGIVYAGVAIWLRVD